MGTQNECLLYENWFNDKSWVYDRSMKFYWILHVTKTKNWNHLHDNEKLFKNIANNGFSLRSLFAFRLTCADLCCGLQVNVCCVWSWILCTFCVCVLLVTENHNVSAKLLKRTTFYRRCCSQRSAQQFGRKWFLWTCNRYTSETPSIPNRVDVYISFTFLQCS